MSPVALEARKGYQIVRMKLDPPGVEEIGKSINIGVGEREQLGYKGETGGVLWIGWVQGTKEGGFVGQHELAADEVLNIPDNLNPKLTAIGTALDEIG